MGIYIGLLCFIVLFSGLIKSIIPDRDVQERILLRWGVLLIFLLLALKKHTVGIDIPGYMKQYDLSRFRDWSDTDYVYFENGYIYLMKLFSKANLSFQFFTVFLYAVHCIGLYSFIKKYSKNATLSLLTYVCYMFLVFSISALRQMFAMGVCMMAVCILDKGRPRHIAFSLLLVYLATTVHQSSIVFFGVIFLYFIKKTRISLSFYVLATLASIFLRKYVWSIVNQFIKHVDDSSQITLGGNFIFLILISFFLYFIYCQNDPDSIFQLNKGSATRREPLFLDVYAMRVIFSSLSINILFSGSTLLRSNMYFALFLLAAVPNAIDQLDGRLKILFNWAFSIFLVVLFYFETLAINQFLLCPYKFFWQ